MNDRNYKGSKSINTSDNSTTAKMIIRINKIRPIIIICIIILAFIMGGYAIIKTMDSPDNDDINIMNSKTASLETNDNFKFEEYIYDNKFKQELNKVCNKDRISKYNFNSEVNIDLNGDGINEKINVAEQYIAESNYKIPCININGSNFTDNYLQSFADSYEIFYYIVDINTEDLYREIAIVSPGPSNDPCTIFYYYNDEGTLQYMGDVYDYPSNYLFNSDGTFDGIFRLSALQTWYATQTYCLDSKHRITCQIQDVYEVDSTWKINLLIDLTVYSEMNTSSKKAIIKPQACVINMTNNDNFFHIVFENGEEGWFTTDDIKGDINSVFDGLNFAD